jgi:hypothetical protein
MAPADVVASLGFSCWFALSYFAQFRRSAVALLISWDNFGAIPSFLLFAPNPPTSDHTIIYRDYLRDGAVSSWSQIQHVAYSGWWNAVWNPHFRTCKAFFDCVQAFLRDVEKLDPVGLIEGAPYRILLNYVRAHPHLEDSVGMQFALLRSSDRGDNLKHVPMYVSEVIRLQHRGCPVE